MKITQLYYKKVGKHYFEYDIIKNIITGSIGLREDQLNVFKKLTNININIIQ